MWHHTEAVVWLSCTKPGIFPRRHEVSGDSGFPDSATEEVLDGHCFQGLLAVAQHTAISYSLELY